MPPDPASRRYLVRGVEFDLIDYDAVLQTIEQWRARGDRRYVVFSNPHSVEMCRRDGEMGAATARAGLTVPDGTGIIWAAHILGYPHRGRVTGPQLMLRLCEWGCPRGYRHYFYGGGEGVAEELVRRLRSRFGDLQVAGTFCPPFRTLSPQEEDEVVARINASRPDVVWVGLGAPKQEKWMQRHVGRIQATAMIGVGAAFDFHSGNVPWAPAWIRRLGIEWAYRLLREPRRLWRRNLDSPLFLAGVLWQRLTGRK